MKYFRVIACTLIVAFVAVSQTATGSLSGMVTDAVGIAIPKAKVLAVQTSDRRASFETRTNDSGTFTFTNLPPDVYQVRVTREDVGTTTERTISVARSKTVELNIQFSTGCDDVPDGSVSDEDKAEVFRSILAEASRSGFLDQKQRETGVVLSTQNIKPDWARGLPDLRIQLLTPVEIQRKAESEGDFQFLSVPEMKVRSQRIAVTLSNGWAKSKGSKNLYLSGAGSTYEYRKESGKWVGKFISGWIL
jgi:hypothetical protein